MKRPVDIRLYLVTDSQLSRPSSIEKTVAAAVAGGVTCVQLREKQTATRDFIDLARRLLDLLKPADVPLIINDRVDVVLASGADGVHLGQKDMPFPEARRILGPEAQIGLSVETFDQALEAESWDVDYIAASPVFPTPTKKDTARPWGLDGLRLLRKQTKHRIVAIGGIDANNAGSVLEAGADGIAVVSAICAASDPEHAARQLRKIIDLYSRK